MLSMVDLGGVDSRQYRFGFVANSRKELPADFDDCEIRRSFVSALFLPRDDAGWFGRSRYPPRIIFLYDDAIEIRAHRTSGEQPGHIPLCELQFLELGRILLHGWLRFAGERCDRNLLYNTVNSLSVRRFLAPLRSAFLPHGPEGRSRGTASFGQPPDLKFRNACVSELMPEEEVLVQFFQPAQRRLRRFGLLKRESWFSADLLAITDRRIMWITDRHRERHEPYGTITMFAPLKAIAEWAFIRSQTGASLAVALEAGGTWRIPVRFEAEAGARAFIQAAEAR
jgi:hypothetical protein